MRSILEHVSTWTLPKVHVRCVDARGQAITRFPSTRHIPVTAYNPPSLVTSLLASLPPCHEGLHSWISFISCYLKRTDLCQRNIPHTVHECFRGSRFSPFVQPRCHCLIANHRQGRLWICAKIPFPWLHVTWCNSTEPSFPNNSCSYSLQIGLCLQSNAQLEFTGLRYFVLMQVWSNCETLSLTKAVEMLSEPAVF